jgi:hypothetical protein
MGTCRFILSAEPSDSVCSVPESVVRKLLAAWADPKPDELVSFFDDGAVWVDGRRGLADVKTDFGFARHDLGRAPAPGSR